MRSDENHSIRCLKSAVRAPEEFLTNLALRIEYRIGERDLNLFCASENVVAIADSCSKRRARRRALLAAYEPVMTDNHRSVIGEITHAPYQCREAGELARSVI
jgi:hypothetical protein